MLLASITATAVASVQFRKWFFLPRPFFSFRSKFQGQPVTVGSAGKKSTCNAGDLGLIPGLERSPREGKDYPLQCSGLENSMDCYSPWGRKESDTTERLSLHFKQVLALLQLHECHKLLFFFNKTTIPKMWFCSGCYADKKQQAATFKIYL